MKVRAICLSLGLCIALSSCTSVSSSIEEKMLENAGIEQDANYQQYHAYDDGGKLDEQGYYKEDLFVNAQRTETNTNAGTVHVTFASNSYLDIAYFKDSACTDPLNGAECYLKPGDCIYAQVAVNEDAPGGYIFSEFQIYRYEEGKRRLVSTSGQNESGLVLELIADHENAEIAIEPVGRYELLVITLHDYWKGEDESTHELNGTWMIDEKPIVGDSVTLNPVSSYIICYDYDESQYFYVSSTPGEFEHIPADGLVIFEQRKPDGNAPTDYTVELHKCITAVIPSDSNRKISYKVNLDISTKSENDKQQLPSLLQDSLAAGDQLEISGLAYEDTICILTDSEWKEIEYCQQLVVVGEPESVYVTVDHKTQRYFKYTMQVPPAEDAFEFNPNNYSYAHGTVRFIWRGQEVNDTVYIPVGGTLYYEAKTHDARYGLTSGMVKIVADAEKNHQMLENISFTEQVKKTVTLKQPEAGGKITYKVDGKIITSSSYTAYTETVITMDFTPWEGWECAAQDGTTYTIKHNGPITVNGMDVSKIFKEAERHKPTLEVVLDKSLGTNMQFGISASGLPTVSGHFDENRLKTNKTITLLKDILIGTEKGISISISNDTILSGTAIKILIEKTDADGNKATDYRLIDDLTEAQDPIAIYEKGELGVSTVQYKSIKVTISLVEVMTYTAPKTVANATVSVKNSVGRYLKNGDLIEGNEKIILTIKAKNGYYVDGKNVENDIYTSSMKFSKYQSDIQDIIESHPIGKYYKVTLTDWDSYGVCTYELDGNPVSGTILAKEGQKLTMHYKITTPGYVFEGAKGLVFGIGKNTQEKTESITVTAALDGKTVAKDYFGIVVGKGE